MNVSLYQAAAALDGNIKWQQSIAENLAAGSTPAYKKNEIAFSTLQAGVMVADPTSPFSVKNPTLLPKPSVSVNHVQGSLRGTGSNTDLALDGPGFFAVRRPDGQILYTRDGEFRVNLQGEIRNKDGYELVAEGGNPIIVNPRNKDFISVSPEGDVSEGGLIRGRFSLFEFPDRSALTRIGNGYYLAPEELVPAPAAETQIAQSRLEAANTLPTAEVSSLMLALRHYEANQKVIQLHDERTGRTVQELTATT